MGYLLTPEVAKRLGVSPEYVRDLVRDGRLQAFRLTPKGRLHFRPEDVAGAMRTARPTIQPTNSGV